MMHTKIFLVFLLMFFCSSFFPVCSDENVRNPNVLVYTTCLNPDDGKKAHADILNERMAESLSGENFNAIIMEADILVPELIDSAIWMGAFFVLEVIFSSKDAAGNLSVRAYSSWDGSLIVEDRIHCPNLDDVPRNLLQSAVVPVLQEYLESDGARDLASRLESIPVPAVVNETATDNKTVPDDETAGSVDDESVPEESSGVPKAAAREENVPGDEKPRGREPSVSANLPDTPETVSYKPSRFRCIFEAGSFISAFDTAEYFDSAVDVSLEGVFRVFASGIVIEGGAVLRYSDFSAEGSFQDAQARLWSLGAVLFVEPAGNTVVRPCFKSGVGASFLSMDTEAQGALNKIIPFLSWGIGAGFNVQQRWGINCMVGYTVFIEESVLLSGFTPAIGMFYWID